MTAREERCSCGQYWGYPGKEKPERVPDPNCPVHPPDVAKPRRRSKSSEVGLTPNIDTATDNLDCSPGPSVHHDETHGYHTADGEPVMERLRGITADEAESDPYIAEAARDAVAEIERLRAENIKLRETLERLDDELSEPRMIGVALPRLRKMIANALAAKSLEGK